MVSNMLLTMMELILAKNIRRKVMETFVVSILLAGPAFADCMQPFIEEPDPGHVPIKAGLVLPISSQIFAFENCPTETENPKCLLRASISDDEHPEVGLTLSFMPSALTVLEDEAGDQLTTIASSVSGARIVAARIEEVGTHVVRVDHAIGSDHSYILSVEHPISQNYPDIETFQAFIRQSIVVCTE